MPGLSPATDITLIAGHSVPHACTASSKLHKDATQSARHPCELGIIIAICRTRKPREVHSPPQGCLAGGWQDLSFVLGVADSTVLCHQDSPLLPLEQCHQRELLTAGHGPLHSRTFFPFALATPKIRANSIFRGCASNDSDAWAATRSVSVARRCCLILHEELSDITI